MSGKYLFLHIPKAAGTSLFRLFAGTLGPENVKMVGDAGNLGSYTEPLKRYRLVSGHFRYYQRKYFEEDRYCITFLRDPIDRFVSQYFFYRNAPTVPDAGVLNAQSLDLGEYIDYHRGQTCNTVCNAQVWFLTGGTEEDTGPALLDLAMENLAKVDFTGIYEFLSDSVDLLFYDCKWPPPGEMPVENVTGKRPRLQEIDRDIISRIAELNRYDLELYEYGKRLFDQKKRKILRECIMRNNAGTGTEGPAILPPPEEGGHSQQKTGAGPDTSGVSGNCRIKIISADIHGDVSRSPVIKSGEMATISIIYESFVSVEAMTVGIMIENQYGQSVFGINSFHLGEVFPVEKDNTYCASFKLRMDLGEGLYKLNVSLNAHPDVAANRYHCWENACSFVVSGYEGFYCAGMTRLYPGVTVNKAVKMRPLGGDEAGNISLKVVEVREKMLRKQFFQGMVEISNNSGVVISSFPSNPVYLSYHWLDAVGGRVVEFEGERSPFFPPLLPSCTGRYRFNIKAPDRRGEYILRVTLVQEHVAWFDRMEGRLYEDVPVAVE
ncbi:MAG: Wzt carbohydrate-binding domain-containing protein [Bacillota bacterium]